MSSPKNLKKKEIISEISYNELFSYLTLHPMMDPQFNVVFRKKLTGWYSSGQAKLTTMDTIHRKCWFVNSGMIIALMGIGKRESLQLIFKAGKLAILPDSFFLNQMPNCYFLACPDTHLLEFSHEDLKEIFAEFPEAKDLSHLILSSNTANYMEKAVLTQFPPKERIIEFHRRYPDTFGANRKVKLQDRLQANYLDIDRSTYCRLQKQIDNDKSWLDINPVYL